MSKSLPNNGALSSQKVPRVKTQVYEDSGQKRVRYIALTRLTPIRKSNLKSQIFVKIDSPSIPFSFEFDKAFIIT